jgi:hypothetical protein
LKTGRILAGLAFAAALANFAAFAYISMRLGGDAVNGMVKDGHYFVMAHGKYTEVSKEDWTYSLWHARSVWVTHPLGLLGAWYLAKTKKD